MEFVLLQ